MLNMSKGKSHNNMGCVFFTIQLEVLDQMVKDSGQPFRH